MLPGMASGSSGASFSSGMPVSSTPGSSLLGKEMPPAPLSPLTQPLNSGAMPPLALGGVPGRDLSASAMPAGHSIASLRAPRGANFIRLAFAAVFMIGFLGIVGYLLKDHLPPDIFPKLAGQEKAETSPTSSTGMSSSQPALPPALPGSTPAAEDIASKTIKPESMPTATAEASPKKNTPSAGGFDPAEVITRAVQPADSAMTSSGNTMPSGTSPQKTPPPGVMLEVSSKPPVVAGSPPPSAATPEMTAKAPETAEDDTPPEARPAMNALKKFLAASTLSERLGHTLGAEHMKPLMERYYSRIVDGPLVVDRIQFVRMDPNPEIGSGRHCIFSIENKAWEFPVPVMLEEQPDGFKVDWLAFVEFKDRLLEKFFQAYQEGPARFHVGIIRHHYFEDGVPNVERKDAFRVMPAPPNSYQASVFLDKDSALAQELRVRLPWETHVWAVVELEWKKLGSQQWVELSAVPQMHWYSLPMSPRQVSTIHKTGEGDELPPGISKNGVRGKSGGKPGTGGDLPPPGIQKSSPDLPPTIRRPLPAGR